MANDVTGNPWVLDTPGAGLVWTGNVKIANAELAGYAADADNAILKDAAGRVVAVLNGSVDLQTVRTGKIAWVNGGLAIPTLTSGKVYVYLDTK